MQIVGQVIKGTVVVVDIYGKEQTLGKGQTIVLGDTIKAKSEDAYVLFDTNPDPVLISESDAIEVDEDFLDYLAAQAKKAQEGVENTVVEDAQGEEIQDFIENDDENQKDNTDTLLSNTSINSIDLFDTHIQTLELTHDFDEKETTQESNLQFALVGDNGQYYLRGSDTEKLIVLAHARNGTLSDADHDRHFEVLEVDRGNIPVEEINTVLHTTKLPLQSTEDVPAVVQDVVDTLGTWHNGKNLSEHDMQVLGIDHTGIDVANVNKALEYTKFYEGTENTLADFYTKTQDIIQTLHSLADNHTISNEQLHSLGITFPETLSEGEISYLNMLMETKNLHPDNSDFLTQLATNSKDVYTGVLQPIDLDLITSSDTGVSNDNRTSNRTPTLSINLPADVSPGDIIQLYDGSHLLDTHTLTKDEATAHTLDITLGTLAEGEHALTATITDAHGNVSHATALNAPSVLTIDTTASISIDTNIVEDDDVINAEEHDKPLTITGTSIGVEAGQTVAVTFADKPYTATIQADGTWSVTVPAENVKDLTDGNTYGITANVSDVSANVAETATRTIEVNTSANIKIAKIADDNTINANESNNDVIIQGTSTGIAENQTVRIEIVSKDDPSTVIFTDTTTVKDVKGKTQEGSWSYTLVPSNITTLLDGDYIVNVLVDDDGAGNSTEVATPLNIDTSADADNNFTVNAVEAYKITNNAEKTNVAVGFTGVDADTVSIAVTFTDTTGKRVEAQATQANGTWSVTGVDLSTLKDGSIKISTLTTDDAGNTDTATNNLDLDTSADVDNNFTVNAVEAYQITNNAEKTNVAVGFTGVDADTVSIAVTFTDTTGKSVEAQATQVNGTWSVTGVDLSTLKDGTIKISTLTTDDAGNTVTSKESTFTLDTSADGDANSGGDGIPLAITLSDASDTGVKGDNQTNNTTPTLDLKGIDADAVNIIVHVGEETYSIHRDDAKSAWEGDDVASFTIDKNNTVTGLTSDAITEDREYPIDIQVTDDAGNATEVIKGESITLDTQVNVATITQDTTAKWHLALDPDIVHIEIGTDTNTGVTTVGTAELKDGKWVITPTDSSAYTIQGSIEGGFEVKDAGNLPIQSISTIVTDDAGNKSHASDSSLTAATVTLTDATNSGSNDDNITNEKPQFTIDLAGQTDLLSIEVKYANSGHIMASAHRASVNDEWTIDQGDISINGTTATYTAPFSNNTHDGTYTYRVELQDANAQASETVKSTDFSVVYDTTAPTSLEQNMTFNEDTKGSPSFTNVPTDAHLGENSITITDIPKGWHIVLADGSVMKEGTKLSADELSSIEVTPPKDYYGTQYISYTATDIADNTSNGQITVTVNNVNDAPVISDAPDSVTLTESDATLTATGTMTVTDVDKTDTITPSVTMVEVKGPTNIDNATLQSMLELNVTSTNDATKDTLTWKFNSGSNEAFDYLGAGETLVLTYTVQVNDGKSTDTNTVTITIKGTNDAPVITSKTSASVEEDSNDTDILYTVEATDVDTANTSITYSITKDDSHLFEIDAKSGEVTLITGKNLDYETATSHTITVEASDGKGGSQTKDITIKVTDVNEFDVGAVSDSDKNNNEVSEHAGQGTEVGIQASATDKDGSDTVTYSLTNPDGLFTINQNTGVVTVDKDLSNKVGKHTITIRATSTDGSHSEENFTITVTDATPPEVKSITSEMNENGELVYTFTFTEAVEGFTEENITIENASVETGSLTGKNGDSVYTVIVVPYVGTQDVNVGIAKDVVSDLAGNKNTESYTDTKTVYMGDDNLNDISESTKKYDYISLKDGDDTLTLTDYANANIDFGSGEDTLIIDTTDKVDLSNIHHVEHIETSIKNVNIIGTENNDTLTLKGGMYDGLYAGNIDLKGGNDTLIIDTNRTVNLSHITSVENRETSSNLSHFNINGTTRNDTLTLKGGLTGSGDIDLKGGDDTIIIDTQKDVYLSRIHNVENISVNQVGTLYGTNSADTITLTSNNFNSIKLRDNDDTLTLKSGHDSSKNIDFGKGEDTLIIDTNKTVNLSHITSVENIETSSNLSHFNINGTTGNDTLTLKGGLTSSGDIDLKGGDDTLLIDTTDKIDLSKVSNVENIEVEKAGSISGSTGADTLTLNTSNFTNINLGEGTDTLLISDDTTIDLSKVNNIENITLNSGAKLDMINISTLIENENNTIIITDFDHKKDNNNDNNKETVSLDKDNFKDTNSNGTIDENDATTVTHDGHAYDHYTSSDGTHFIEIEQTLTLDWQ